MASPRPRVPPVTTATRPLRSNRSFTSSADRVAAGVSVRDNGATSCGLWGRVLVADREVRDAVLRSVLRDAFADRLRVQQEVEVAEDLPHDQQRLAGHGSRRPQVRGDLVRARPAVTEHLEDAIAAATVLGEPFLDEARVV